MGRAFVNKYGGKTKAGWKILDRNLPIGGEGLVLTPSPGQLPIDTRLTEEPNYETKFVQQLKNRLTDPASLEALLEAQKKLRGGLSSEVLRVKKVRSNVLPAAEKLAKDSEAVLSDSDAMDRFYDSLNADNPKELRTAIANYPANLKNVLPAQGKYNLAAWDKQNDTWHYGSEPYRELYCTPYGCLNYQKAGAADVPTIPGNYGFVGGVAKGSLPFEEVPAGSAEGGDVGIVYGEAPSSYTSKELPGSKGNPYVNRPHHTTVLASPPKVVNGKAAEIEAWNANEGERLKWQKDLRTAGGEEKESYKFYRYIGKTRQRKKEVDDNWEYYGTIPEPQVAANTFKHGGALRSKPLLPAKNGWKIID